MSEAQPNAQSRLRWLVGLCFAALGTAAATLISASKPLPPEPSRANLSDMTVPHEAPVSASHRAATLDAVPSESSLMSRLHALGESDPAATLGLALEGNLRFPGGEAAPERGWMICRSLVNLRRFSEAVEMARLIVDRYPDTPWAADVQRHLLVNPMSDPSERGYGHQLEIE